tara:strand:- start:983 stop:1831 length:849 start_codon:yes stop_codon:yes gene_type:complete
MPSIKQVADLKSSILRPSLTSIFYVEVPLPTNEGSDSAFRQFLQEEGVTWASSQETLNLLCAEASLPGSSTAVFEINNDRSGVTERHAHRKVFDDRINLTFYVDVEQYLPIMFFESWIKYISGAGTINDNTPSASNYFYRMNYADDYTADQGLKVIKFEKDYKSKESVSWKQTGQQLEYQFYRAFPIAINSMPVSYDTSNILKCTVSMSYIRYIVQRTTSSETSTQSKTTPANKSEFNVNLKSRDLNYGDMIKTDYSSIYNNPNPPIDFSSAINLKSAFSTK